jgi:hypothetical protein
MPKMSHAVLVARQSPDPELLAVVHRFRRAQAIEEVVRVLAYCRVSEPGDDLVGK